MKCWLCEKELVGVKNFCVHCGMPQGKALEFASAIKGIGYAKFKHLRGMFRG